MRYKLTFFALLASLLALAGGPLSPARAAVPIAPFQDNFESDAAGSAPVGTWVDQAGHPVTVVAGSPLSAPNWLTSGSPTLKFIHGANSAFAYTGGDVQLSFVVHSAGGGYQGEYAAFSFVDGDIAPIISGANVVWYDYKSGAVLASVPLPAFYAEGAKTTWKEEYDNTAAGGPTVRLKIWPYGAAEPAAWTLTAQLTATANQFSGGFDLSTSARDTGTSGANAALDDYFEGPVGSTFSAAPAVQAIPPNAAGIVYDKGVFALSATNAVCVDAGGKFSLAFTGSQLILKTNEGDGNQWVRYHIVTPGATAAQGPTPPWVSVNLPAGPANTVLDTGDADPTLLHTCYVSFYRHGYTDLWGSSAQAIPTNALNITGYLIDATASLGTVPASPFTDSAILIGDSIPEGYGADPVTGLPDATWNWVEGVFRGLKCNGSRFVHGGQGYHVGGSGNVPPFNTAYGNLFFGQSRLNAQGKLPFPVKFAILEHCVNGGATQADITTALTNLRAMTDPSTLVVQLLPLGGQGGTATSSGNVASFVANYKAATGDQKVFVADTSAYGLSESLTGSTGVPGYRGHDTLHPDNNQAGEIAGAVVAAILQATAPPAAPAGPRSYARPPSRSR